MISGLVHKELVGKTLTNVVVNDESVDFTTSDNKNYRMYHLQDCCESVWVYKTEGDISDIIGSEIVDVTEEILEGSHPIWYVEVDNNNYWESFTWSIYRITSKKGSFMIAWVGNSNGYYSESVYFSEY